MRTRPDHPDALDVQEMFDYVEDFVKPYFERLTGISSVRGVYGGTERQMQVMIDPTKLADRGIAISRVREAIRSRNRDVSGGDPGRGQAALQRPHSWPLRIRCRHRKYHY